MRYIYLLLLMCFSFSLTSQVNSDNLTTIDSLLNSDKLLSIGRGSFQNVTLEDLKAFVAQTGVDTFYRSNDTLFLKTLEPETLFVIIPDASATNEIQTLSLSGSDLTLSNGGGTVALPSGGGGTDDQTLSLSGTTLSIESGNSVDLSVVQDGVDDADASTTNEIQTLSISGNDLTLSNSGGTVTLPSSSISGLTTNKVPVAASATSIENGSIFDDGSNVGIGTITPSTPLHVYKVGEVSVATFGSSLGNVTIDGNGFSVSRASANYFTASSVGGYMRFVTNGNGGSFYSMQLSATGTVDFRGNVGILTSSPGYTLDINSTNAVRIPVGTTAQRPTGAVGVLRGNSTTARPEYHTGTAFESILLEGDETTATTPTGNTDSAGTEGNIYYDDNYIYIKTSAGWKRAALSTF